MDSTLIANINDATATSEFLKSQRDLVESVYKNDNSYLSQAQQYSNSYMEMKQRIPMVIEYYVTPEQIETVEMYINPEKLSFNFSKIIGRQVTRGGIFFNHYGDDTPKMTLSGCTGLSGMKGIEQLEKIYFYSGTLLRYQNVGINKIDNGISESRVIINPNNAVEIFDNLIQSNSTNYTAISETYEELLKKTNLKIENNKELLSKTKMAKLISEDIHLLYSSVILSNYNGEFKVVVAEVNDELSKENRTYTFQEIFDTTKKYLRNTKFGQAAIINDTPTNIDNAAFEIAYNIYESSYNNLKNENSNTTSSSSNNSGSKEYSIYECVNFNYLYLGPDYRTTRLSYLSVGGIFTAEKDSITNNNWIKHINDGYWTKIKDNDTDNDWHAMSDNLFLYSRPPKNLIELKGDSLKISTKNISINGVFTSLDNKIEQTEFYDENGNYLKYEWIRHADKHEGKDAWVLVRTTNLQTYEITHYLQKFEFLKLKHETVKFYTVISKDAYLYNDSNFTSGKFRKDALYWGGKFTAIAFNGNWVKHIDGGWCPISSNGVTYLQEGFDESQSAINNNTINTNTVVSSNDITTSITEISTDAVTNLQKYLTEVRTWNKNSVIKRFEVESGFADIRDELTDEWRPRLVFIYFEDRVFLGHFESFNYERVATTENITYSMSFIIQRIVSVTSISPNRFEQSNNLTAELEDWEKTEQYYAEECAKGNDLPIKIAILRARCIYYREMQEAQWTGVPMTETRKNQIHNWTETLRNSSIYNGKQLITDSTPIYGNTKFDYHTYMNFIQLQYIDNNGSYFVGTGKTADVVNDAQGYLNLKKTAAGDLITVTDIQTQDNLKLINDVVEPELERVVKVWETESKKGYSKERKKEIYTHANNLIYSLGARYFNNSNFKKIFNNYSYIRDNKETEL